MQNFTVRSLPNYLVTDLDAFFIELTQTALYL